jgi:ribosomal protein S18 acetylase RimI-like enzyme
MEMNIEIIGFREELADHFTMLNLAWLKKYFVVEPIDNEILSDPKKFIIDKGGFIFFASFEGEIAGTFALIKIDDGVFELSKMAVDESFQGKKIGNKMLEFCISEVKKMYATKLILYSNTKLQPAIFLYRKYGFTEIPLVNSEYKRSNIKMEINFN